MLKLIKMYFPFSDIEATVKKNMPDEYKNSNFNVANVITNYTTRAIEFDVYISDDNIEKKDRRYRFDAGKIPMQSEVIDMKQAINEMMSDEYKKDKSTHYEFYSGEDDSWVDSDEITIDDLVAKRDNFIVVKTTNKK